MEDAEKKVNEQPKVRAMQEARGEFTQMMNNGEPDSPLHHHRRDGGQQRLQRLLRELRRLRRRVRLRKLPLRKNRP